MMTSTSGQSRSPTRAGPGRRGLLRTFYVLGLAAWGAAGCGEASPLDGSLAGWLRGATGQARSAATAAVTSDAGSSPGDAGASSPCEADAFEPNDDLSIASLLDARSVAALLCGETDIDYHRFAAPSAAGTQFSVRVRFDAALGDIDVVLMSAADGAVVDESSSVIDEEVVSAVSDGAEYVVEVALFEPGPAAGTPYTLELLVAAGAENDCCTESAAPGCNDAGVRECVCAADPYCCVSGFDAYCVGLGVSECGSPCSGPPNPGSCCSESTASGCGDASVEACVCDLAPFCCSGPYDSACVSIASGVCGGECEEAAP